MPNPAALAYEAYVKARGQKMRERPSRMVRPGSMRRTKPAGARLWEELPDDEKAGWWAAVVAVTRP